MRKATRPEKFELVKATEFDAWYEELKVTEKVLVDARLERIVNEEHFGSNTRRFDGITELKWKGGLRVYTSEQPQAEPTKEKPEPMPELWALYGGNKNGQSKDIRKAKKILANLIAARSDKDAKK